MIKVYVIKCANEKYLAYDIERNEYDDFTTLPFRAVLFFDKEYGKEELLRVKEEYPELMIDSLHELTFQTVKVD